MPVKVFLTKHSNCHERKTIYYKQVTAADKAAWREGRDMRNGPGNNKHDSGGTGF